MEACLSSSFAIPSNSPSVNGPILCRAHSSGLSVVLPPNFWAIAQSTACGIELAAAYWLPSRGKFAPMLQLLGEVHCATYQLRFHPGHMLLDLIYAVASAFAPMSTVAIWPLLLELPALESQTEEIGAVAQALPKFAPNTVSSLLDVHWVEGHDKVFAIGAQHLSAPCKYPCILSAIPSVARPCVQTICIHSLSLRRHSLLANLLCQNHVRTLLHVSDQPFVQVMLESVPMLQVVGPMNM